MLLPTQLLGSLLIIILRLTPPGKVHVGKPGNIYTSSNFVDRLSLDLKLCYLLSVNIAKTIKVMYNQSIRIVLKMTVERSNEILIANVTFSDWSKNIAPVFQPTRSKTNRALYARFFLRFFWKF